MTSDLDTSLGTAASAGELDRLKTLLASEHESPSEETVQDLLEAAAKSANLGVLEFLLGQHPTGGLNEEIVRGSIYARSIPIFKALLARDSAIINMRFDMCGTPLIVACQGRGSAEYLRSLLRTDVDPNMNPDTSSYPLALVAFFNADPDAMDVLLRYGARPQGTGALAHAAMHGKEAMVLKLLEFGAQ